MVIDGFTPEQARAFGGYDDAVARRFWRETGRFARAIGASFRGLELVPPGGALIVGNHAFGWDIALPMAAIAEATGRRVWALGEHLWWKVPFVRRAAAAVGTVDGTNENVDALLSAGELVFVMPGGLREAVKPRELRYRLLWGQRFGFVRAALRNRVPLVPLAGLGADDLFDFVGDAFARGASLGLAGLPIPKPRYGIPWIRRHRLEYEVGAPVVPRLFDGEAEAEGVLRIRREIRGALEELIDEGLARRAGVGAP